MKRILKILFFGILAVMFYVTVKASLDRNVFQGLRELMPDPWFQVTLWDAYFAFLAVWLWIAYKEKGWAVKAGWFVGIMLLGNFAIAIYFLIQLFRLKPEESVEKIWTRNP